MTSITIPNNWRPRPYQREAWRYLEQGGKRAYIIAHRRWGKDDLSLHWTACAVLQRVGNYWHMLPEASQARKAIWDAINPHTGKRRIDEAFPPAIRKRTIDNEMKIEFVNGSIWQVLGSDNYNSYVGSPPVGIIFSEWPIADPMAWAYVMPILEENSGWAIFIGTPRGRNHGARFYSMAQDAEGWLALKQTASETGVFTADQLNRIKLEMIAQYGQDEGESNFEQEYNCSFDSALPGAYYGKEMNAAETEGRISNVPYNSDAEVFAVFDLGHGDSTAISFVQIVGMQPCIFDYHESSGQDVAFYAKLLRDKPYSVRRLILPHDGANSHLEGKSCEQQFKAFGFDVTVLPRGDLDQDIKTTRAFIKRAWFDKTRCERLVDCLRSYHREWDEKNKIFKPTPKHDWASHGADSFRYVAVAELNGKLKTYSINYAELYN